MLERWQKKKKNNKTAKEMNEPAPKFTLNPASELLAKLGMKYEKRKVEWFSSVPRAWPMCRNVCLCVPRVNDSSPPS